MTTTMPTQQVRQSGAMTKPSKGRRRHPARLRPGASTRQTRRTAIAPIDRPRASYPKIQQCSLHSCQSGQKIMLQSGIEMLFIVGTFILTALIRAGLSRQKDA